MLQSRTADCRANPPRPPLQAEPDPMPFVIASATKQSGFAATGKLDGFAALLLANGGDTTWAPIRPRKSYFAWGCFRYFGSGGQNPSTGAFPRRPPIRL